MAKFIQFDAVNPVVLIVLVIVLVPPIDACITMYEIPVKLNKLPPVDILKTVEVVALVNNIVPRDPNAIDLRTETPLVNKPISNVLSFKLRFPPPSVRVLVLATKM